MKKWKQTRKTAFFALTLFCGALIGIGAWAYAKSDGVFAVGESVAEFKMYEGASVRKTSEDDDVGGGIRFGAYITEAYFNGMSDATAVVLESTVSAKIGENDETFTYSWVLKGENAVAMEYDENGKMNFYHAIMFNDLYAEAGLDSVEASALDMIGKMTLTVDGEEREAEGTAFYARSARIVAYHEYLDSDRLDVELEGYIGGGVETTLSNVNEYVFMEENGNVLQAVWGTQAEHGSLSLYEGLNKIGFNKNITSEDFNSYGETKQFTAFDENNKIYNVTAMYVTKAIKTEEDLRVFELSKDNLTFYNAIDETCKITGYFVLANDLQCSEKWESNQHALAVDATKAFFSGTFNGLGHTMEFNAQAGGLFGNVVGGTINDTEMISRLTTGNHSNSNVNLNWATVAAVFGNGEEVGRAVLDNCCVRIEELDFAGYNNQTLYCGLVSDIGDYSVLSNLVVSWDKDLSGNNDINHGLFFHSIPDTDHETVASVLLLVNNDAPIGGDGTYAFYAANDDGIVADGDACKKITGMRRYFSREALQNDVNNCNVANFNAMWQTVNGVPFWKNSLEIVWNGALEDMSVGEQSTISAKVENLDLEIISILGYDESIIDVDGLTIKAVGVGETEYRVRYKLNGKLYSRAFEIEVLPVQVTVEKRIDYFSVADGDLDGAFFQYGETVSDILSATQLLGGYEVPLRIEDGKLFGVTPNISEVTTRNVAWSSTTYCEGAIRYSKTYLNQSTETLTGLGNRPIYDKTVLPIQITVKTPFATYVLKEVMAYTKVIDEISDWEALYTANAVGAYNKTTYEYVDGYYILANDIDFEGASVNSPKGTPFRGVFDGNGKTVKNFVTSNGLFGLLNYHETFNGKDAVVKNVAFVGDSTDFGIFGQYIAKRTSIFNVYISVRLTAADAAVLTANLDCNTVLENVIIEIEDVTGQARTGGLLAATASGATFTNRACQNVYVLVKDHLDVAVSKTQLIDYSAPNGSYALEMFAGNIDISEKGAATSASEYVGKISGIFQYESGYSVTDSTGTLTLGNWKITETKNGEIVTDRDITWVNA